MPDMITEPEPRAVLSTDIDSDGDGRWRINGITVALLFGDNGRLWRQHLTVSEIATLEALGLKIDGTGRIALDE